MIKKSLRNWNDILKTFSRCAYLNVEKSSRRLSETLKHFPRCAPLYVKKSLRKLSDILKKGFWGGDLDEMIDFQRRISRDL